MDAAPRGRHARGQTPASPRVPLFTFPGAPRRQQVPGVGTGVPRKAGTAPNALLNPHGQSQWFRELKETGPPSLTTSKRILLRLLCNNVARTRPQAVGRASEEARMGVTGRRASRHGPAGLQRVSRGRSRGGLLDGPGLPQAAGMDTRSDVVEAPWRPSGSERRPCGRVTSV